MEKNVLFLRGINVGGKNILPMNELTLILENLGLKNVKTYIQSGNVVFEGKGLSFEKLSSEIGAAINERYAFTPSILLISGADYIQAIQNNPFDATNGKLLHCFFTETRPDNPNLDSLKKIQSTTEQFKLVDRFFYLYAPDGIGRSKLASKVEKAIGVPVTARNWNTVSKVLSMLD
ncbi:DUF1697 domain-containing protein [Aliikangiella coralliicola]|uniref:DUF1697 domain-containing protein n=1 Tax=Aliikangiella coralliicola TaxID=2592383 RepID=A0A545U4H1_9GAMM|nr:DUF1697 domain-containing protein [Aliikangiella coralliicola]TQV84377.1 DUF1697 domain-containing protein [Aliikangiella coralliicola]